MKKAILHIGMHKTGSSSIQDYLQENQTPTKAKDIIYADLKTANHSGPLLYALLDTPEEDNELIANSKDREDILEKALFYKNRLNHCLSLDFNTIILSSEALIKLNHQELSNFKKKLLDHVDEVKVMAYVRPPVEYINSAFQQIAKTSYVELDSPLSLPNYQSRFEKFEEVFDKIDYYLFTKDSLINGNVVEDFCTRVGIDYIGNANSNESLSPLGVKTILAIQKNKKTLNQIDDIVDQIALTTESDEKFSLPRSTIENLINAAKPDISWMEKKLGKELNIINSNKIATNEDELKTISKSDINKLLPLILDRRFNEKVKEHTNLSMLECLEHYSSKKIEFNNSLRFNVEAFNTSYISGWMADIDCLQEKLNYEVYLNGQLASINTANLPREDLKNANLHDGNFGFYIDLEGRITNHKTIVKIKIKDTITFKKMLINQKSHH
ncbi:hypothetical protein R7040_08795 [Vibrio sp. 1069]|uniref:hypothetical protein n=1 Tax=Vibrio TaxID=662 RepID=UPI001A8F4AC6|nr:MULTISPECIES: hypothetical protein [Vibrio]MBO0162918.1 hypothetical protein [Vibrio alginolyticus]MDW2331195.1 hypothetical protein [Vibrio sp. 1069]HCZ9264377.1 hypothetical protein [Vibrio alginolyticus]